MYTDHNKARKKTESQEKNWVEWLGYKEMVKELGQKAKSLRGTLSARERVRLHGRHISNVSLGRLTRVTRR
eukprot:SAG31_NODE_15574_length_748_cov_1.030817_1_plen_71_part_00